MSRTILITGTSSGIGRATADLLLEKGYRVIGVSRRAVDIDHLCYQHLYCDLMKEKERKELLANLRKNPTLDAVILNAGIGHFAHVEELSMKDYRDMMECNFFANAHIVSKLLPHLKKAKKGNIIFISSKSAIRTGKRGSAYSASKFALRGFFLALREECSSSSVQVTNIQPGMVETPFFKTENFTPGREETQHIKAKDIAETCLFALEMRLGTVLEEITIAPLKHVVNHKKETKTG